MDLTLPFCTYETRFSNHFYYRGKGRTANVTGGTYTGSGTRYRLTKLFFSKNLPQITSTTTVLGTYATEDEAFEAEAQLVPLELLMDPYCLNDTEGGRRGKFRNRNTLMKSISAEKKRLAREKRAAAAKLKKLKTAEQLKVLKKKLREKK